MLSPTRGCFGRVMLCCFVFLLCCVAFLFLSKHLMDDKNYYTIPSSLYSLFRAWLTAMLAESRREVAFLMWRMERWGRLAPNQRRPHLCYRLMPYRLDLKYTYMYIHISTRVHEKEKTRQMVDSCFRLVGPHQLRVYLADMYMYIYLCYMHMHIHVRTSYKPWPRGVYISKLIFYEIQCNNTGEHDR